MKLEKLDKALGEYHRALALNKLSRVCRGMIGGTGESLHRLEPVPVRPETDR
jgi:hypothetical protein